MSETTRFTNSPISSESGWGVFNRKWKSVRFCFARRAFESKLERILRATYGHEGNALPAGDYEYELLNTEAHAICTEFSDCWGLDADLLKAQIPGLAKLEGLAVPPPTKNYARLACFGMVAIPLALILMGAMAGLVNVGFHLIGGR